MTTPVGTRAAGKQATQPRRQEEPRTPHCAERVELEGAARRPAAPAASRTKQPRHYEEPRAQHCAEHA